MNTTEEEEEKKRFLSSRHYYYYGDLFLFFFVTLTLTPILFTFDFFGEFDPVRVSEGAGLLVYVVDVQHFAHELDNRLGLVEGGGRHCQRKDTILVTRKTKHQSISRVQIVSSGHFYKALSTKSGDFGVTAHP